jgi:cytochrome P450
VWAVSSDTQHFTVSRGTAPAQVVTKEQIGTPMLNSTDPPAHSELRAALRPRFLPRNLREIEPDVRAIVRDLLAPLLARGGGDVVAEFGSRLSTRVACLLIGLPLADGDTLHRLVTRFFHHNPEPRRRPEPTPASASTHHHTPRGRPARRPPQQQGNDDPTASAWRRAPRRDSSFS